MATKPTMHFIATTSDKLESIAIKAGQLIFVQDERAIYLDASNKRTSYKAIMQVANEETRQGLVSPIEGYYYVMLDNTLWSYFNKTWAQITGKDSSIVFADGDLPEEGTRNAIYVDDIRLYRWNENTNSYDPIAAGGEINWEIMAE